MKETTFLKEEQFFSPFATKSAATKGRKLYEEPCEMRTEFQRDRDRIIYSKAFRRLKNKTQVFFSPDGDHYMTRLTHTLDVSQIARSIARSLNLNEDLAEAIALGHDLGHTPFGHTGERILNGLNPQGFEHNVQSLRVVDFLENDGKGLNLTEEVRDGILNHKKSGKPSTIEGEVVSISDRIAYLNHDIDDAVRAGILAPEDIPKEYKEVLGNSTSERINIMITSICKNSVGKPHIEMGAEVKEATEKLRDYMFKNVYKTPLAISEEGRASEMITALYEHFKKCPEALPEFYLNDSAEFGLDTAISDYISCMTDRYAVYVFEEIFLPKNFFMR
ncbi:MAG: deoxyguanosinetriphosphate triphosphohydrolase [Clostridia bacterium]|nr:deoxyguanosinetriphosphate triphosphohydrolase [Clostridia bacterium]